MRDPTQGPDDGSIRVHWSGRNAWLTAGTIAVLSLAVSALSIGRGYGIELWIHLVALVTFTGLALRRGLRMRQGAWLSMAAFGACISVAQVLWIRAGVIGGPADGGTVEGGIYIVGVVFGALGIGVLVYGPLRGAQRWRSISDGLVVASCVVFALWTFVYEPQFAGLGPAARSQQYDRLSYVGIDLLFGCVLLLAAVYQPGRAVIRWVAAAVLMVGLGDGIIVWQTGRGEAGANPVSVAIWTIATCFLAVAAAAPDLVPGNGDRGERVTNPRRRVVQAAVMLAVLTVGGQIVLQGSMDTPTLVILLVTGVAVVTNQIWVNEEVLALARTKDAALDQVASSERRFRSVFEEAPVGMVIGRPDGTVLTANPALGRMLGVPPENLAGRTVRAFISPDDLAARDAQIESVVSGRVDAVLRRMRLPRADGTPLWVDVSVSSYSAGDDEDRIIGVVEDVTEQVASRSRLEYLASHDTLTGLTNRHRFTARLTDLLDGHGTHADTPAGVPAELPAEAMVSVAFIDLDRFKVINDSLGHEIGDRLLLELASRIEWTVGDRGMVARFGGDEFTLLLTPADGDELRRTVDAVLDAVAEPVDLPSGERFHPTVSIGVTTARPGSTADGLISEADAAMYRAKERGRNRCEYFAPSGRHRAQVTLRLMDELHRAVERDELVLHYQPIVDVASGLTSGYEALLRWNHPDRGLLAPAHFIDVAEESGLIVDIGDWVVRTACARAAGWPVLSAGFAPSVSVNVAARQLSDAGLTEIVADALTSSGLPAERLWLEMTETAVMTDPRVAGQSLHDLRGLGLHLALDDFGTGYSSLTYLKRFPFETIKIDRSFVDGLGVDANDTAIVGAVAGLARSLGLVSVAEGVETPLQLKALGDLGCDFVQGYLLGRPQPVPTVEEDGRPDATGPTLPAGLPRGTAVRR